MKKILLPVIAVVICILIFGNRNRYDTLCGYYRDNITLYANAVADKLDYEALEQRGICPLLALMDNPADTVYMGFVKMNSKDVQIFYTRPELSDDGLNIIALSCFHRDTKKTPFLTIAGERDRFVLCSNGKDCVLAEYASNSASQSAVFFWKLSDSGELEMIEGVLYDYDVDPDNPCFIVKDTSFDATKGTHCTEQEADVLIDKYAPVRTLDNKAFPIKEFINEVDTL